jgi:hypothetical protein
MQPGTAIRVGLGLDGLGPKNLDQKTWTKRLWELGLMDQGLASQAPKAVSLEKAWAKAGFRRS